MVSKQYGWMIAIAIAGIAMVPRSHDEASLMVDYSTPPPWPIFIAVNAIADALQAAANALVPPPIRMMGMAYDFHRSIFAYMAAKYKIPDELAKGPKTASEIALILNARPSLVERLMYACMSNGIFKLTSPSETGEPRFINTALSAVLRRDHPSGMWGMLMHSVKDTYGAFGKLPEFFENTSSIPWDRANTEFPFADGGFWAYLQQDSEAESTFGQAMSEINSLGATAMVADGPWSRFGRVVDVGGGRGHFLHRILDAYPSTTGVLFDRPPAISLAKEAYTKEFASAAGRVDFVVGSFFNASTIPPAKDGDAYLFRHVLHDWHTHDVITILRNVRSAIADKNATLLIGECAMPDRGRVADFKVLYNMDFIMAVLFDAKERTPAEWKIILSDTGFDLVAIHPTRSPIHFFEARPL